MKIFQMCDKCREEYLNPSDRRFHAQPIACTECGPQLFLWDKNGKVISEKHSALEQTVNLIQQGNIIALKGLGGFQLSVDATNDFAVSELRRRKHREEKPFALMFPSLESIKEVCDVSETEERVLKSSESPIVLLKKKSGIRYQVSGIPESVAPNNSYLGVMLPYTPLHHLLMKELSAIGGPIVATSANLSEEPICIDEYEALKRLKGIADYFLVHNRPIVRHVDDSIVRIIKDREMVMRRARGYTPLPLIVTEKYFSADDEDVLAVGPHLKNTIALKKGKNIFISQHIGDLSTDESNRTFVKTIDDFQSLYNSNPDIILSDLHPEYISTKYAKQLTGNIEQFQHHFAHIAACRFENRVEGEAMGVSWDGTGYGLDGAIWGGEFFLSDDNSFDHFAQFKKFMLPGGEKAIKEPRRSLAGVLYEIAGDSFIYNFDDLIEDKFTYAESKLILNMLSRNINAPFTSSVGRFFDAVSSLLGIYDKSTYEGQAAMMLEFAADWSENSSYPFEVNKNKKFTIDWIPLVTSIVNDLRKDVSSPIISAKFHNTLAKIILKVAKKSGRQKVVLSGGCFQNALLTERTISLLQKNGYKIYWHQRIPTNDGGISLGQVAAYLMKHKQEAEKANQLTKELN
jgi:hydrogenase maturation protein HypF